MTAQPPRRPSTAPPDSDDQEGLAARANRRLAEVEALSGIGSWEWDIRTDALHWSKQLCQVYGVEAQPDPITYEQFLAHVHPDDRDEVDATVRHAFETGGSFLTEHRAVHPDGSIHVISGRGYVLVDEDGTPIRMLGSGQDVTAEREAVARQTAEERRHAAGTARDDALALLAHDLRSPLSVIVGYVQLLERQAQKGLPEPERLMPYLERIEVAASQMTSLMDDLLADASPDAEAEPIELEPTDLTAWLRQIVDHQEATVATHQVLADAPDRPVVAPVNRPKLERAIHNLVTNAVKYSDEGSTVRVMLTETADELHIAVADEGVGIPPEDLPHIFERFHRGGNVTGRVGGLGLGLTSALRAVRAHKGSIVVESVESQGTTFTIALPRSR